MEVSKPDLASSLPKQWVWFAMRGVLTIFFALFVCFLSPLFDAWRAAGFFAIFALMQGVVYITLAWHLQKSGLRWSPYLSFGLIGISFSIVIFSWPEISMVELSYIIAIWAILAGISDVVVDLLLTRARDQGWLLLIGGVIIFLFGFLLFTRPAHNYLSLFYPLGLLTLCVGVISSIFAGKLHKEEEMRIK